MKRTVKNLALWVSAGFILYSCEMSSLLEDDKVIDLLEEGVNVSQGGSESFRMAALGTDLDYPDYITDELNARSSVLINTYNIEFLSRVVNDSNADNITTTFNYRVSGTGIQPSLDSFFLEVPECAVSPLSWTPSNASSFNEGYIKWNSSVTPNSTQNYAVTYPGIVGIGLTEAVVTKGSNSQSGVVLGPCEGIFTLQGSIYIDSNEDGSKQNSESGLSGFPIQLINNDNGNVITTIQTEANGSFLFYVFEGSYAVKVVTDLINRNYNPTGEIELNVGFVNKDETGLDFGYLIDSQKMIKEFEDGTIPLDTKDSKFWTAELRNPGKGQSQYNRAQMLDILVKIEGLLLPVPFNFGSDKIATALSIIAKPIKTELDAYLQQLLTAELNIVSGRGAKTLDSNGNVISDDKFNEALLRYAEPIACSALGACDSGSTSNARVITSSTINASTSGSLRDGTEVLSSFNGTGGIRIR